MVVKGMGGKFAPRQYAESYIGSRLALSSRGQTARAKSNCQRQTLPLGESDDAGIIEGSRQCKVPCPMPWILQALFALSAFTSTARSSWPIRRGSRVRPKRRPIFGKCMGHKSTTPVVPNQERRARGGRRLAKSLPTQLRNRCIRAPVDRLINCTGRCIVGAEPLEAAAHGGGRMDCHERIGQSID